MKQQYSRIILIIDLINKSCKLIAKVGIVKVCVGKVCKGMVKVCIVKVFAKVCVGIVVCRIFIGFQLAQNVLYEDRSFNTCPGS